MENFSFENKTRILFGRGVEDDVGKETKKRADRVLLHYGTGSVIRSGLLDRVKRSLEAAKVEVVELGGAQPNPRVSLVREGIALCRTREIGFVLAIGGGSVIDSAKAIGVGVPYSGDVWDFYAGKAKPASTIPVGTVLTIPAAGSESSPSSVITNEEGALKRGLTCDLTRPVFSFLNPELSFSLPPYQTACGCADIMAHVMERYFTPTKKVDLTDRLCEATLRSVIVNLPKALLDPKDYDARAEIMWAGCIAHNDLLGTGRIGDWASHGIEHELSGIYDVAHGAGLAVVFPAWMRHVYRKDMDRFCQFATRVWGIEPTFFDSEVAALQGIAKLKAFFTENGLPVSLGELKIPADRITEMAKKATNNDSSQLGNFLRLRQKDVEEILMSAL